MLSGTNVASGQIAALVLVRLPFFSHLSIIYTLTHLQISLLDTLLTYLPLNTLLLVRVVAAF
jgi:hypothetical protein